MVVSGASLKSARNGTRCTRARNAASAGKTGCSLVVRNSFHVGLICRSKIRLAVCRCFFGRCLSSARMASITPCHGPSLGRRIGVLPPIPRRQRILQHLAYRLPRQPELPGHRPPALALDKNRPPHPRIDLHGVHTSGVPRRKALLTGSEPCSLPLIGSVVHGTRMWRVDYFYPATSRRFRGATWSIFDPARTQVLCPRAMICPSLRAMFHLRPAEGAQSAHRVPGRSVFIRG